MTIKCKICFFKMVDEKIVKTRSIKVYVDHPLEVDEIAHQRIKPDERFHTLEFKK